MQVVDNSGHQARLQDSTVKNTASRAGRPSNIPVLALLLAMKLTTRGKRLN